MEWNEKLQLIIDYVEHHLQREEEPVDSGEVALLAGCSYQFFQKVFSYLNGFSFADYIRFRKMTLAGYDLKSKNIKVIHVSYKYGYDSPTSFAKAFKQFHGVSPKDARAGHVQLHIFPRMQLSTNRQYTWRIEQSPAFRLVGKCIRISCEDNRHYNQIPEFWSVCQRNGVLSGLIRMDAGTPPGMFGLAAYYDDDKNEIEYAIMVKSDAEPPQGYIGITIPEVSWAVFDCRGPVPRAIQNGWRYLREEWLLKYPFRHANVPELEWYSDGNPCDEGYLSQIRIPVLEEY